MREHRCVLVVIIFVLLLPSVFAENTGSVVGIVVDRLNNLVDGADVKGYCGVLVVSDITDKFGTFVLRKLPVGDCTFYARFSNGVGFSDIVVEVNKTKEMQIMLDKTIVSTSRTRYYVASILIFVLLIVGVVLFFFREKLKPKKLFSIVNTPIKRGVSRTTKKSFVQNEKVKLLLKGLSEREQQIVKCLITHKGEATQSKIYLETKIPKASLSRHIKNLETKSLISIETIGKLKRVTLKQ